MSTMWSTCSMSTGHCSTQAPQVVQDHSTSGSMTPPCSRVPTSGRAACSGPEPGTRPNPDSGTEWKLLSVNPAEKSIEPSSGVSSAPRM
jgi:hypothetical protein